MSDKFSQPADAIHWDIHPLDYGLWCRVIPIAFEVAKAHKLTLRTLRPTPLPGGYTNQTVNGCCYPHLGAIHLVLRFKTDAGAWMPAPRPEADVWRTLAHELAHLEETRHSPRFWALMESIAADVDAARRK